MSKETIQTLFVDEIFATSLNTTTRYEFRSIITTRDGLNSSPYFRNTLNRRGLVAKWGPVRTEHLEEFYFEMLEGDTDVALETALIQQSSTLVSFFSSQLIDIPSCFRKAKASHSSFADKPKLRLVTMLMRHGKKLKVSKLYSLSALNISLMYTSNALTSGCEADWRLAHSLFSQLTSLTSPRGPLYSLPASTETEIHDKHMQLSSNVGQYVSDHDYASELLFDEILSYMPSFSFFIKRVDKMKRRHSRGKSGRYEMTWKYVPPYKRLLVVLRWLMRDIRFQAPKTFQKRIEKSLEVLLLNKPTHLVFQSRQFVHKFVFRKYRKTLLYNLRSPS